MSGHLYPGGPVTRHASLEWLFFCLWFSLIKATPVKKFWAIPTKGKGKAGKCSFRISWKHLEVGRGKLGQTGANWDIRPQTEQRSLSGTQNLDHFSSIIILRLSMTCQVHLFFFISTPFFELSLGVLKFFSFSASNVLKFFPFSASMCLAMYLFLQRNFSYWYN